MPAGVSADANSFAAMGCGFGCIISIVSGATTLDFLVLDFDTPGFFTFADFGEMIF